jgi:hypothetical protein
MTSDTDPVQRTNDGTLTYRGRTWAVTSEPVVIESEGDEELVEVWVKKQRGEGIGESS